jgi:TetR/AcrR family transcriptional regulator, mexJK operon transcriptional repressor
MSIPVKNANPGRPKDLEKRAAILEAAKRLFLGAGYGATSMDAVAAEAGVSKLTVYNHFSDKQTLFREAVAAVGEAYLPHELFEVRAKATLRDQLLMIGRRFHALVNGPESIAAMRTVTAEARVSNEVGPIFYEAGPARCLNEMTHFLEGVRAAGKLAVPDPHRAASHFFAMLKGEAHMCLLMGFRDPPSAAEVEVHVKDVIDVFLRAYSS